MRFSPITAAVAIALALATTARAQSTATVAGLDVYRSRHLTAAQAKELGGALLDSYVRLKLGHRRGTEHAEARVKAQVEEKLRRESGAAFVSVYVGEYVTLSQLAAYVTVDVVDPEDARARMPFRPAPRGRAVDPQGLLSAWQQYSSLGDALERQGTIDGSVHPGCPGYFCLWGSPTPEMAALEKRFHEGALPDRKLLERVLQSEADAGKRAAALYVLSYLPDGRDVVSLCYDGLQDPAPEVRAAALQILSDVALYHKGVLIDLSKVLPALDYPTVGDRGKALSVLVGLSDNASYHGLLLTRAAPYLLGLLRLRQPANHDLAFTLLSTLSQQSLGQRDYAGWASWVKSQNSAAAEAPGVSTDETPAP